MKEDLLLQRDAPHWDPHPHTAVCLLIKLDDPCAQASLMINETDKNMRLAGGAVHFQATHAVDELGALRYVSTGSPSYSGQTLLG